MALYYFDIHAPHEVSRDEIGIECGTREAVRIAAIETLPDMAADLVPGGDNQTISVDVRDDGGKHVFRATLQLTAGWLDDE